MKAISFLVLFLLVLGGCGEENTASADPIADPTIPSTPWTRLLGSTETDEARAVTVDPSGYVYIAGSTLGALPGQTAPASEAAFLAKYDPDGTRMWIRTFSADRDQAMALTLGQDGYVYLTGGTYGGLYGQVNNGSQDVFVAKHDTNGNPVWGRLFGTTANSGNHQENGQDIAVDADGNIYVVGITSGGLGDTWLGYNNSMFVLKLDNSGDKLWLTNFGLPVAPGVFTFGYGIALSGSAVYAVGSMGGSYDGQTNQGEADLVLFKLQAADGARLWTRMLGSDRGDAGKDVAVDGSGNIYVTGNSGGDFDGHTNPSTGGVQYRMIIAKFDPSGTRLWSRLVAGQSPDNAEIGNGITVAPSGDIYVTGASAIVDGFNIKDLAVLRFTPDGTLVRTAVYDSGSNDEAYGITADANSRLYVAGYTCDPLLGEAHAGPAGSMDIALLKIRPDLSP